MAAATESIVTHTPEDKSKEWFAKHAATPFKLKRLRKLNNPLFRFTYANDDLRPTFDLPWAEDHFDYLVKHRWYEWLLVSLAFTPLYSCWILREIKVFFVINRVLLWTHSFFGWPKK
jgi:hypothetical protein